MSDINKWKNKLEKKVFYPFYRDVKDVLFFFFNDKLLIINYFVPTYKREGCCLDFKYLYRLSTTQTTKKSFH